MTNRQSGYHLSVPMVTHRDQAAYPVSCSDKSGLGRAVLQRYYMWHFSMQGLPVNNVTIKNCELLPHIFNLTPTLSTSGEGEGSYFLWHFLLRWPSPKHPALHRCIALCCPDFPPLNKLRSDSLACSNAKLNSNISIGRIFR